MRDEKQQKTLDEIVKRTPEEKTDAAGKWTDNPGTNTYQDKMLGSRILRTNRVMA